ncbi:hypothetical protein HYALB_00013353 [Hymenoscyphus albidus]|uniref:Uncharacterized protein n=1 Tax=Hymenoscyphus albidus TaxID=595503 RepID=A0A9N9M287_9HELO|nr:hypothetical protein HYALB_00013353 [Hymenoscyphus albidus]
MQIGKEEDGLKSLENSDVSNATDRPTNRVKRRRLNISDGVGPGTVITGSNNHEDFLSGIQSSARSDNVDQGTRETSIVIDLTKIQKALEQSVPAEKKRARGCLRGQSLILLDT